MTDTNARPSVTSVKGSPAFWRTQEMLLIDQIVRLIGRGMQLDPILREMLHLMSEMLGLNRGRVVLADADAKSCRIRYWYGLTRKEAERGRYALGEGITGRALALSQLIIVQDIDKDPTFLARAVERARLPATVVSFIAMPIMVSQKAVGVLACHRIRHRNRPMSSDVAIMRILASLTGQFLELNAAMEQKTRVLEQRNDMLARALEAQTAKYGIIGTSPALPSHARAAPAGAGRRSSRGRLPDVPADTAGSRRCAAVGVAVRGNLADPCRERCICTPSCGRCRADGRWQSG
jgi:Nif-specific regulatory protein